VSRAEGSLGVQPFFCSDFMTAAAMPYAKVKTLGGGAFGKIFVVKDEAGSDWVMKEVSLRGLCPKEQRRSLAEVKILRKLEHPHLVGYHDSSIRTADKALCIVMELCDGGDLAQRIAACQATKKKFSERSLLRVAGQAVSALAYCHHKCVCHSTPRSLARGYNDLLLRPFADPPKSLLLQAVPFAPRHQAGEPLSHAAWRHQDRRLRFEQVARSQLTEV
jgi:serine/threonine protein kinase